jgi:hypothetical protein
MDHCSTTPGQGLRDSAEVADFRSSSLSVPFPLHGFKGWCLKPLLAAFLVLSLKLIQNKSNPLSVPWAVSPSVWFPLENSCQFLLFSSPCEMI